MRAVIDIGSNTIRMLLGSACDGNILPHSYHRTTCRLAGGFSTQTGLSQASMHRAIATLKSYHTAILLQDITHVRVVGTAALRRAENRQEFIENVFSSTGLRVEVISGEEEALATTTGILSALDPIPESIIVIDIGGGSTELVCLIAGIVQFQESYPLGVVRLCEECASEYEIQQQIDTVIKKFIKSLRAAGLNNRVFQLIGTAGTVTTLAAIHLQLKEYDAALINNHEITTAWIETLYQKLKLISVAQRETLTGMESGRGDLILPGLQILLSLTRHLQLSTIKVIDAGLLEGIMLGLTES